jgi:hypothetical protein
VRASYSFTIPGYNGFETATVKKIDKKYLPAAGATKFYIIRGGDGYLHTSIDGSEETRAHSKDIDAAISRGAIVLYGVYEDGGLNFITYPCRINSGVSGYRIYAYDEDGNLTDYKTSDYMVVS